jgi:uncharacterized membrane protein YczE
LKAITSDEATGSRKANPKFFISGSVILMALHSLAGYLQVPQKVMDVGLSRGFYAGSIKFGYTLGIFSIFAMLAPLICVLFSLLSKKRRNMLSVLQIIFWSLLITFFLNLLMGFIFAPKVMQNLSF